MISATIQVTRIVNDEEQDIDVYLSGQTERFGSCNPYERGECVVDWHVDEPKGFELTKAEEVRAEQALERAI